MPCCAEPHLKMRGHVHFRKCERKMSICDPESPGVPESRVHGSEMTATDANPLENTPSVSPPHHNRTPGLCK
jgi:hypothetical protein